MVSPKNIYTTNNKRSYIQRLDLASPLVEHTIYFPNWKFLCGVLLPTLMSSLFQDVALGTSLFFFQDTLSEQTNKTIQMDLVFHGSSVGQPLETISVKILIFSYNA